MKNEKWNEMKWKNEKKNISRFRAIAAKITANIFTWLLSLYEMCLISSS